MKEEWDQWRLGYENKRTDIENSLGVGRLVYDVVEGTLSGVGV